MGIRHLLLLLIYLDPLSVLSAATGGKKPKQASRKAPKATAVPTVVPPQKTPQPAPASTHDTCLGYYDVSGQYDKMFECNNTDHRYCCGTCYLRFCCEYKKDRLDQKACKNYHTPVWVQTAAPSPIPTGETYDPSMDQTNTAVYITCGIIAFIIVLGVSVKVAYDKATEPPQEMNIHRALADILRQQGPIPISQYDCENFAAMNGSPKDNTPVRTSSKNHYTPVHTSKSNHGLHYGKESVRSSGGADLHNFISSGFVTLGRGHQKGEKHWPVRSQSHHGTHQHNYNHVALGSPTRTPKNENNRISGILTSQTEPYDLSFSRSFQSLSHLPPSYEAAVKADLSRFSSLKKLTDKDVDEYYTRKRHLPDLAARGTLPLHVLKMSQDQHRDQPQQHQSQAPSSSISQAPPQSQSSQQQSQQRQRPRRVQRAMSQDRVLSPQRVPQQEYSMSSNGMSPYGGRILSDEQLLSAERLRSQERLLPQDRHTSQDRLYSKDRMYSKDRLLSQDHLYSKDRHYSQDRLYSQERLYSQDRLLSQDPLLSPDKLMMSLKRGMVSSISGGFRGSDKSISRAISHTDVFIPTTPLMDRYKMTKMHSHPSASNNGGGGGAQGGGGGAGGGAGGGGGTGHSNTLAMNQTASKRQAFASRRTHTVEQLHYIPQHHQQQQQPQHYRTGSKTEVTV
ncbi:protein shisa-6 homolog isoform X3 [Seriola lalandi dorsalis]|uniref:protein shisa-6 homolog isoform X3 n=1 Tax=Seriola lalandi dorsalis TaxID=1841481 RepID=UPI000C6FB7FF|nr:protein shisa-6 homolog isoform X3 [Seriola lalandi dorsalis]